jgi:Cu-processing system ATP-binding protein
MKSIIKMNNISKHFGKVSAVDNVELDIKEGELFGLIGPNGAGKTTIFKMLLGVLKPTEGTITYSGQDLYSKWSRELRSNIGYLPENVVFYDHLSGRETLEYFAKLKGTSKEDLSEIIETLGIAHYVDRNVKDYSKGMRQRIGLAQAILGKPKILFLDEPTTGLDPKGISEFFEVIFNLKKNGTTIIITSHILREIQDRVDRLGIMLEGRLHAVGNIDELKKGLELDYAILITAFDKSNKIQSHLEELNLETHLRENHKVLVKINNEQKLNVLDHLMSIKNEIKDIEMSSPGLDDIFLSLVQKGKI